MRSLVIVAAIAAAVATSCSAATATLATAGTCQASTSTVSDIYDQLRAGAGDSPTVSDVADQPLCAGGPTGRELVNVANLARQQWCAHDPAPGPFLLYRADISWNRGVVVLDFERADGSGYREPSKDEIAAILGIDADLVELHREPFAKMSRCLP